MPKSYLALEERKRAEAEKKNKLENAYVGSEIKKAMKRNKVKYEDVIRKADTSTATISKAIQNPNLLAVDRLREICFAAGLRLVLDVEPI